jgi:hypothetical protein
VVPRYSFRIEDGDNSDVVNMDYSDAKTMQADALRLGGTSIQDMGISHVHPQKWSLHVSDDTGREIFSIIVDVRDS